MTGCFLGVFFKTLLMYSFSLLLREEAVASSFLAFWWLFCGSPHELGPAGPQATKYRLVQS